ncbi:MAG: hypothetical protein COA74_13775 [Gammaproteobacteria bacterium]|nr:MAG: hypothetical protein COA74_13775 [Gammaproteobacteria bacterium]
MLLEVRLIKTPTSQLFSIVQAILLAIFSITSTINAFASVDEDKDLFSYQDIFNLEYAASPQISVDGKSVVYERRSFDIMTDGTRVNIWQVDINGNNHRPLLSGKASYRMPRFSPNGKKLAYISAIEGKNQLYIRWLDTGQTARITDLQHSPGNLSWSPDGKWIAFSMLTPQSPKTIFKDMPKKPKGADWAGTAKYIDRMNYKSNAQGFLPRGYSHIYVVPTTGGTARQVTQGSYHHNGTINWTKDSQNIISLVYPPPKAVAWTRAKPLS